MNTWKTNKLSLLILISMISLPIQAGQLYRFLDENGVPTVSKSLPPYAAQKGYDILNDKSLRLIKHVAPALTTEQIAEQAQQRATQEEAQRQAELAKKQQQEQKRQQDIYDKNLLASYRSEQELLESRDSALSYREKELEKINKHLAESKQKLHDFQQQAADQELSGNQVSANLKKRLSGAQQEISVSQSEIERLEAEIIQLTEQYRTDLIRLNELLANNKN